MGITVRCNSQVVWSPGYMAGNLFADEMEALERITGMRSGVAFRVSEILDIDAPTFSTFIASVLQFLDQTNNGPLVAMASGCVAVAIALNAQITGQWPVVSDRLEPLVQRARTVLEAIPPGTPLVPA